MLRNICIIYKQAFRDVPILTLDHFILSRANGSPRRLTNNKNEWHATAEERYIYNHTFEIVTFLHNLCLVQPPCVYRLSPICCGYKDAFEQSVSSIVNLYFTR